MKFLIPTYGRAKRQQTLKFLEDCGCTDITLQTQDERDMRILSKEYGANIKVRYDNADRLSKNANNGLKSFDDGELVCVLDDDIRSFTYFDSSKGTRRKAEPRQFTSAIEGLMAKMERTGANVGITFPLSDQSMASAARKSKYATNALGTGSLMMLRVGSVWYDERLTSCEDYDIQLKEIVEGRTIIRCNILAPNQLARSRKNGHQDGGRGFFYEDGEHVANIMSVVDRYAPIARVGRNGTSIKLDKRYI